MYQRLSDNYTKKYYLNMVESTRQIILNILNQEKTPLWNSILSQIEDIQYKIKNKIIEDWEDLPNIEFDEIYGVTKDECDALGLQLREKDM